jgi:hypothetical protein
MAVLADLEGRVATLAARVDAADATGANGRGGLKSAPTPLGVATCHGRRASGWSGR